MYLSTALSTLAILTLTSALTITSPTGGSTVSLSSSVLITWHYTISDPATFTLEIINLVSGSSAASQTLATDVKTTDGSYTVPQGVLFSYGTGFQIWAVSDSGEPIGESGTFDLADGVYTLSTESNGVLTVVTSATSTEAVPTNPAGGAVATTSASEAGTVASTTVAATSATPVVSKGTPIQATRPATSTSSSSTSASTSASSTAGSSDGQGGSPFDTNNAASATVKQSLLVVGAVFAGVLALLV